MAIQNRRSVTQLQMDRIQIAELHFIQQMTYNEIAEYLSETTGREINATTVANDLHVIRKTYQQQVAESAEDAVARELYTINRVESEAWGAWETSKLGKTTETKSESAGVLNGSQQGVATRSQRQTKISDPGDIAALRVVLQAAKQRAELKGVSLSDDNTNSVNVVINQIDANLLAAAQNEINMLQDQKSNNE